jgi:hypothetical protein
MLLTAVGAAQPLRAVSARTFYTTENQGELILLGDQSVLARDDLRADVLFGGIPLAQTVTLGRGRRLTIPFSLAALPDGESDVVCVLTASAAETWQTTARVVKLPPRRSAVAVDRVGGGLIVDGLPFFPFGFYCYSPVQPTLAEEEVVKGLNLMCPYQGNDARGRDERRRYLDRCAELGMKVHYQLLSVSGGSADPAEAAERERLLRAEVGSFRDHPALLAWYISDEPDGRGTAPDDLARTYQIVHQLDPYHPVTIVFMDPGQAQRYAEAMDVAMTDPYPIPHHPPATVQRAIATLTSAFDGEKPVWLVPQAFGGNEWWPREPTAREQRVMTYLGLIHGATGIQYFVRHGLNGFPKSTSMWAECGRMALEVAELTPALLSHEERPGVKAAPDVIHAAAWHDRGMITVLAVNTDNRPQLARLTVDGVGFSGKAEVLFEGREIGVAQGAIEDILDGFGTRVYQIPAGPFPEETVAADPGNKIVNPSFEENPSPGTPEGCYAQVGSGRGATYFVDSRVARHGRHSVRLVTPRSDQWVTLNPYAPSVTKGKTYRLSVWAKAAEPARRPQPARRRGLLSRLVRVFRRPRAESRPPTLKLSVPGIGEATCPLTTEWTEYALEGPVTDELRRSWIGLTLITPGTAWVDLLQFVEVAAEAAGSPAAQGEG